MSSQAVILVTRELNASEITHRLQPAMGWTDQDVENAARHLLERQGDVSRLRARKRAHCFEMGGETELAAVWERIADAIVRAQSSEGGGRYGGYLPVEGVAEHADGGCSEGEALPIDMLKEKALTKADR